MNKAIIFVFFAFLVTTIGVVYAENGEQTETDNGQEIPVEIPQETKDSQNPENLNQDKEMDHKDYFEVDYLTLPTDWKMMAMVKTEHSI
tara:strand:+ start:968 stop:1234 length:267 start_codon:yes stop_codon:yes gene_type:complete